MRQASNEPIELDEVPDTGRMPVPLGAAEDRRLRMAEPLPVKLVAVADVRALAGAGLERELDAFYVRLLRFEREPEEQGLIYRAENHRLIFTVVEPPFEREEMRPIAIDVQSLGEMVLALEEAEIEFVRQRAIFPGRESLLLQDPAGNWVELTASAALW